jgi:signal transduction histidine kinase
MKLGLWPRVKSRRLGSLARGLGRFLDRLLDALRIPAPETSQMLRRITAMERDIILPIKAAAIVMLLSFFLRPWTTRAANALDVANEAAKSFFWIYVAVNGVVAGLLLAMRRLPLALIEWIVFAISLIDAIFLSSLTLVTGGYNSVVYYLFLGMIMRSAVSVPRALSQLILNLTLSACYVLAGIIDVAVAQDLDSNARGILRISEPPDNPAESLMLRLVLLLLMTFCCYGLQVLLERQRRAVEEAREFAMREGQLRSAGRLAAEFAHQIKNPLAIINNAAFSLRRALREGKHVSPDQIRIIQEEVERSDLIITQLMGYAQLSEGRVEKLSVTEELDRAIDQVFPPAAQYPVKVHRDYGSDFPPLLMLRRHLGDAFVNLLQNGREAFDGRHGNVFVSARRLNDYSIEVAIRDDGPGIAPDKHDKIFQAYYTTKEKGTGLGLATVKHNVELYGGTVRLESELGKGARFVLVFPARTLIKMEHS